MIIQNRDGSLVETTAQRWSENDDETCYAEVNADALDTHDTLFDRIVNMAFDVFGARRLDVRVYEDEN